MYVLYIINDYYDYLLWKTNLFKLYKFEKIHHNLKVACHMIKPKRGIHHFIFVQKPIKLSNFGFCIYFYKNQFLINFIIVWYK